VSDVVAAFWLGMKAVTMVLALFIGGAVPVGVLLAVIGWATGRHRTRREGNGEREADRWVADRWARRW